MNVLLLSAGGGGGNILRSVKAMFRRDLAVTQKSDAKYAERLRRSVVARFLDTNEFSLLDVPPDERLLIGATTTRRLGSGHNPDVARAALEESRAEVEALLSGFSVIVLIGTGGKGTGAGTLFPLAQIARAQHKLVIPIFVRPSFERHEVEKRRYDHAINVCGQFDAANIRLIELLNDRGYVDADPQPQSAVWERMNRPIARGLRGLLYVLSDLSQVDPSDLSVMFAGRGRLRIGFSEMDTSLGHEPTEDQVHDAVQGCWDNPYYSFGHRVGTSLICVQGEWSNVVDARIKGRFAALANGEAADATYNPLYARAPHVPKPWGVTAIFAEHTGTYPPLQIEWNVERRPVALPTTPAVVPVAVIAQQTRIEDEPSVPIIPSDLVQPELAAEAAARATQPSKCEFASLWEFARALNRSEPEALALARGGVDGRMTIDSTELRKLVTTFWVRSIFPRLSPDWRDRMLEVLVQNVAIPNYSLRQRRRTLHLSEATFEDLKQIVTETIFPDAIRSDLHLLIAVGTLWGEGALARFEFTQDPENGLKPSRLGSLLGAFRITPSSDSSADHRH
jgi:cell division GTPase FtsZ